MKIQGIVLSGDAKSLGIGSMSEERWESFYKMMRDQKIYPENLDYKDAFTLEFVNNTKWINFENNY